MASLTGYLADGPLQGTTLTLSRVEQSIAVFYEITNSSVTYVLDTVTPEKDTVRYVFDPKQRV